ncbi:MAG: NAD(P)/FAD-dependent oxidoreductase [Desulfocucumaceae bacterium]
MEQIDILIIGAGVVGLAVAAQLSGEFNNLTIALVERHGKFGQETSSRNSEVIHAGIYYPAGSLKAKLCVKGNKMLYDFCQQWEIPCQRLGKLIVARNEEEIKALQAIISQGRGNGVNDLVLLDSVQVNRLEPHVKAVAAVLSPSTGIIDSHSLMARLEWLAAKGNTIMAYRHEVIGAEPGGAGYKVYYRGPGGDLDSIQCRVLINCAGLTADTIAEKLGIDVDRAGYRIYPCKGQYFGVANSKAKMVSRLIYPPPLKGLKGLGIHATKTLDGRLRLGPNAFYVEKPDYDVNGEQVREFYEGVKTYLPFIQQEDLFPDMSGIRPKLQPEGSSFRDFVIQQEAGLKGVINLIGIESPGLTSCLAIAELVRDLADL